MQSTLNSRALFIHFGNLLVSVLGLVVVCWAWMSDRVWLIPTLLGIGVLVYIGVLLPRLVGRKERLRRAQRACAQAEAKWGFAPRDRAGPWINYIDHPLVRRSEAARGHHFYSEWLIIHDGLIVVNPGPSELNESRTEVRYDFTRSRTYAWDGCTPKIPFYWIAIIGIPDWWEKKMAIDYLDNGALKRGEVFWPLAHHASLVHDALYQYLNVSPIDRLTADRLFRSMLREAGMPALVAGVYYLAVRLFGAADQEQERHPDSALQCVTPPGEAVYSQRPTTSPAATPRRSAETP